MGFRQADPQALLRMTITAVSVLVAVLIGAIEALGLVRAEFDLEGSLWGYIGALNENFGVLGYVIFGVFIISWLASLLIYRLRGYDDLDIRIGET
jgi:nickel/cobalt transporter (NiCoT) family protein